MASVLRSYLITDLSSNEVRDHLREDRRLIVPIGACDQYGPHLPIGTCTFLAEAFARDLAADCGVLRAPTVQYGVNVPTESTFPGAASLREKTLHAMMNDLLAAWEDQGFAEFILLTVHDYDDHVEAIATATVAGARVRMVELLNMDLSEVIAEPLAEHGGEAVTSLMLHLYPDRVDLDRATDFVLNRQKGPPRRVDCIPAESAGSIGQPRLATPETGRRLYELIYQKIVSRVMEKER
jgi:creatinine amidohydrolase